MQSTSRKYQSSHLNDRPSPPSSAGRSSDRRRRNQPSLAGSTAGSSTSRNPPDGFRSRNQGGYYANSNSAFFQKFQENYKKQLSGERGTQLYQSAFPIKHIPEKLNFSYRLLGRNIFNKASSSGPGNLSDCSIGGRADRGITRRRRRIQKRFKNYMRFQAQQGNLRDSAAVLSGSLRTSPKRTSIRSNSARSPSYVDSFRSKPAGGGPASEQRSPSHAGLKKRKRASGSDMADSKNKRTSKRRRSGAAGDSPRRSKRSGGGCSSQDTAAEASMAHSSKKRQGRKGRITKHKKGAHHSHHSRDANSKLSKRHSDSTNRDRSMSDMTMRSYSVSFSSSADLSGSLSRSMSNSSFEQSSQSSVYNSSSRHSDCSSRSYPSSYSTCSSQLPALKTKSSVVDGSHRDGRKFRNRNYRGRNAAITAADGGPVSDTSSANHGQHNLDDSIRNDGEECKRHRSRHGKKKLSTKKGMTMTSKAKHKSLAAVNREETLDSRSSCSCSPARKRSAISGGNGGSPCSLVSSPSRAAGRISKASKKRRKQTVSLGNQSADGVNSSRGTKRKGKAVPPSSAKSGNQGDASGTCGLRRTQHFTNKKKDEFSDDSESSLLDLRDNLYPIGHFIRDRETMLEEMLKSIKGKKLSAMLPDILKSRDFEEVKARCLDQLECMSKKRIACILAGKEMTSSSGTEDSSDEQEVGAGAGPGLKHDNGFLQGAPKRRQSAENEFLPDKMRPLESLPDSGPEDFTERIAAAVSKQNSLSAKTEPAASSRTSASTDSSLLRQKKLSNAKGKRESIPSSHSCSLAANARCVRADEDFDDYYQGFKAARRVLINAGHDSLSSTAWTGDAQSPRNTPMSPDPSDRFSGLHDTHYDRSASPSVRRRIICSECENSYSSSDPPSPSSYDTECSACDQRNQTRRRPFIGGLKYKTDVASELDDRDSTDSESAASHMKRWVDTLMQTDDEDETVLVEAELKLILSRRCSRLGTEKTCEPSEENVEQINKNLLVFSIDSVRRDYADSDADDEATDDEVDNEAVAEEFWSSIEQKELTPVVEETVDRCDKENLAEHGGRQLPAESKVHDGLDCIVRPFTQTNWPKTASLRSVGGCNGKHLRTRLELWLLERQAKVLRDELGSRKAVVAEQPPVCDDAAETLEEPLSDVADVVFAIRDFAVANFTVKV